MLIWFNSSPWHLKRVLSEILYLCVAKFYSFRAVFSRHSLIFFYFLLFNVVLFYTRTPCLYLLKIIWPSSHRYSYVWNLSSFLWSFLILVIDLYAFWSSFLHEIILYLPHCCPSLLFHKRCVCSIVSTESAVHQGTSSHSLNWDTTEPNQVGELDPTFFFP